MRFQGLQLLNGQRSLEILLGARINFILGGNPQHASRFAHAQALGVHDDLKRLIPRNVLQPERQCSRHRVRSHDIEIGEICNHLQQRPHFNILKIERQLFSAVSRPLGQLAQIHLLLADFYDKLIIALISAVIPVSNGLYHHAHAFTLLGRGHYLDRRAKVRHVKTTAQSFRQR